MIAYLLNLGGSCYKGPSLPSNSIFQGLETTKAIPKYVNDPNSYLEGGYVTQYGVEKDFQRSRLYASEDSICQGQSFTRIEEIREYAERVCSSEWVREYFPLYTPPKVYLSNFKNSYYYHGTHSIFLCPPHRYERIILHELAHSFVPRPHAYHGRMFCAVYLDLVQHFMPDSIATSLKVSMREKGVRFSPHT